MKIPGAENAVVDVAKVRDYLLSPEHRVGSAKARFFAQLGFEQANWDVLQTELGHFAAQDAQIGATTKFGQKYVGRGYDTRAVRAERSDRCRVDRAKGRGVSEIRHRLSGSEAMTARFHELDTVVLLRDLPEAGLRIGDLGAVVQAYGNEAVEVEFVTASGRTQALLTLPVGDIRSVRDDDLLAVRTAPPVQGAA